MKLRKAFGFEIRKARSSANLSQEELAFRAGYHRTYISLLERGIRSPSLEALFRLCKALGQTPEAFVAQLVRRMKS